ncbi:MAG: hypothetical protein ACTHM7_05945 [Ginsengibacter sp.]
MKTTIDSEAFKQIMQKLESIENLLKERSPGKPSKWVDEKEAMKITGLGKESLRRRRKENTFTWSSETGRKPKYLRKDLEDYIEKNSTRPWK